MRRVAQLDPADVGRIGCGERLGGSPWATKAASNTLASAFGDRFVLGLGVGHRPLVQEMGLDYHSPLQAMRTYLDAMDAAPFTAAGPGRAPTRLLAAMGPRMMSLAAERCDGALPNCSTAEQIRDARTILGHKLLAPSLKVVLATDPTLARAAGRKALAPYWRLPNYMSHLRRSGWSEEDLASGGSDRLVDSLVAWGNVDTVAARVREHVEAGADHVVLHVQPVDDGALPLTEWRVLSSRPRRALTKNKRWSWAWSFPTTSASETHTSIASLVRFTTDRPPMGRAGLGSHTRRRPPTANVTTGSDRPSPGRRRRIAWRCSAEASGKNPDRPGL